MKDNLIRARNVLVPAASNHTPKWKEVNGKWIRAEGGSKKTKKQKNKKNKI